nr:PREDICTED: uncharacterized protein LOC109032977 isoform X1 [Bemisia tabaci]
MTPNNEQNTCRLCGSSSGVFISILDQTYEKYVQKISGLLNIMIYSNDPLPKVLCHRCVIKIDDFQVFVESAHFTQKVLREKFLSSNTLNVSDDGKNHLSLLASNENGLNSSALSEPPTINPPAIISFNLLTCSNSNDDSLGRCRVDSGSNFAAQQLDPEPLSLEYQKEQTPTPSLTRPPGPRRGSRPFPKKPGSMNSSQNHTLEEKSQISKPDSERVPNVTNSTLPEAAEKGHESEGSSTTDEKKLSANSSPPTKKKKKYLSPFEVPSRRKRNRRRLTDAIQRKKKVNKIDSSSDEDTSKPAKKLTSIPEEDLEKYFILTKIPSQGMIYTCKKCEAIFMTAKASSGHTKCLSAEQVSEDEQGGNSSSSESSGGEPSDASKSDEPEKESIYQCSYCDKPFTRNVVCLQHEQTHLRNMTVTDDEEDIYLEPKSKSKKKVVNKFLVEKFLLR